MTLTTVLIDISAVSVLLFLAFLIRQKIPFFYKYYIPTSLIAGILGLLLGPQVLGQFSPVHLQFSEWISQWTNFLFAFIFATSFLGTSTGKFGRDVLSTTCVTGAKSKKTAEYIQTIFMSPVFRIYTSPDMLGVEIGAALKNVIALAAGTADGLGCGDNTKAALITRGIAEIARLGIAMGGKQQTFYGLSGIGDLIVTCASMHSRNRRAGILIGKGYTMDEAMKEVQMVVEGVYSAKAGLLLAQKYGCDMPIVSQVNQVLFDGKSPKEALADLMMRDPRIESSDLPWKG